MSSAAPMTVLVVEDDEDTQANLCDILELDGYRALAVSTMREALACRDWANVGMVILDRRLPDGNAEELLPRLKRMAPDADVIVATGYADLDGAITALRNGASDYIIKPINPAALRASLERTVERRRLSQAKARSDAAFRTLVEAAPALTIILRSDGTILYLNPFAVRLTGFSSQEAVGRNCTDVFHEGAQCNLIDCLVRGGSPQPVRDFEHTLRCKDGTHRAVIFNAEVLDDFDGQPAILAIGHDLTDLNEAQQKALQAERLAAIGQMMAGLTHESRNALQRSKACLEMLALEVEDRPAALDLVRRIEMAQEHLHHLYEEVRTYAAPINIRREACNLGDVWREAWSHLLQLSQEKAVELTEDIAARNLTCGIDAFAVGQVFRNILENAVSAVPDPGKIRIIASDANLEGRPAIKLIFRDNGPGLTAEQHQKIFEPFFTTKTKGTGLGMAIAKRIVQSHGGRIETGDGPGVGAEIIITLPRETE